MKNKTKENTTRCPQCRSSYVVKDGIDSYSGKQRYQCRSCGKNFSDMAHDKIRIIAMSDLHCGHKYGLTPPQWRINEKDDKQCFDFQSESWVWYENMISLWRPFDMCIVNGDLIDGKGGRSGGRELITSDRVAQAEMAYQSIKKIKANRYFITAGTPYHVGDDENFEKVVADKLAVNHDTWFGNKLFLNVNGCKIKARHKIGSSSVPHGRATPLLRSLIWDELNADSRQDRANILLYSHVHYSIFAGYGNNRLALTTPALQGTTEFGAQQMDGVVHFGVVIIDVEKDGMFSHRILKAPLESLKQEQIQ